MGFLGILEPKDATSIVPGTVILDELDAHSESVTGLLKHANGTNGRVVLVPQPFNDPNDPLNWSRTKKIVILSIIALGVILCAATNSVLLNAGLVEIAGELGVSIPKLAQLSGDMLLVGGASGPIVCALARKYAKRPCFFFSSVLALVGTIIGSASGNNYNVLMGARFMQGFAVMAYEALSVSVVGDIFFVHERGRYNSALQFILNAVPNLVSVVTGSVTKHLVWKYLFHLQVAPIGLQTILVFFFVPETTFVRDQRLNLDEATTATANESDQSGEKYAVMAQAVHAEESTEVVPAPKTFWQSTAIFTGTYSDENIFLLIIAPFIACSNLAGLWIFVMSGALSAFYVAVNFVLAQIFSLPPYNLNPDGIGLLSFGPFIGSTIACAILGFLMDSSLRWATHRNKGIYEPEYRLLLPSLGLLTGAGLMGFGAIAQASGSYIGAAACYGLAFAGVMCSIIGSSNYALDAYRDMCNEIFIMNSVFKNFLGYSFTYFVNDWTARAGPKTVFLIFGGLALAVNLSGIIVFVFGKRYRNFWHRHTSCTSFT